LWLGCKCGYLKRRELSSEDEQREELSFWESRLRLLCDRRLPHFPGSGALGALLRVSIAQTSVYLSAKLRSATIQLDQLQNSLCDWGRASLRDEFANRGDIKQPDHCSGEFHGRIRPREISFLGRHVIFLLIISVLLVPLQVLMVPVFLVLKALGWINNLIGIIIPPAATATGTFMMRQYIMGIPDELLESARIDGASHWKIYRHIILPLSVPALGAVGILSFTWRWNDYLWPLIVINNQKNFTLQLSLANLVGTNTVEWGTLLAYANLAMLPVLIVFVCFQRYFLKGSLSGAVKG
jgi:hypothetical protein